MFQKEEEEGGELKSGLFFFIPLQPKIINSVQRDLKPLKA